jgi:hypothetical protein
LGEPVECDACEHPELLLPRNRSAWGIYMQVYDQLLTAQTILVATPMGTTATSGRQALDLVAVIKAIEFLEPDDDDRSLLLTKVRLFHDTIGAERSKERDGR